MDLLTVEHVTKRYASHTALDDVSLAIPKGSVYGLLGPNGAGKTTLIRIINRITAPDAGRVLFGDREIAPDDIYRIGYLLLRLLGPKRILGAWLLRHFGVKVVMTWWSAIFATAVVIFPVMYRTARGAFESFDETLAYSGQTLGLSNAYIFWHIRMPCCRQGILAGTVLAFARALGEYGATSMIAGYTPGKTATISTTVYQLWQTSNDALAMKWVMVNLSISAVVLLTVNMLERRDFLVSGGKRRGTA